MTSVLRSARLCSACRMMISSQRLPSSQVRTVHLAGRTAARRAVLPRSFASISPMQIRTIKSQADQAMEKIEELYEAAREEFQIAAEETEENTIYAADDRKAAREEFEKLKEYFSSVVDGSEYAPDTKEDIRRRAGQRIRELEQAVENLEEKAMHQD